MSGYLWRAPKADWISHRDLLVYASASLVQLHAQKCACVGVIYDGMRICALKPVQACLCMPSVCNNNCIHTALPIYRLTNLWYPCESLARLAHKCCPRRFWAATRLKVRFLPSTSCSVSSEQNVQHVDIVSPLRYNINNIVSHPLAKPSKIPHITNTCG